MNEEKTWIVMEKQAPSGSFADNRRIAVCLVDANRPTPKMISMRSLGMIEIRHEWNCRMSSAQTDAGRARSEYWQARRTAKAMCEQLNAAKAVAQ